MKTPSHLIFVFLILTFFSTSLFANEWKEKFKDSFVETANLIVQNWTKDRGRLRFTFKPEKLTSSSAISGALNVQTIYVTLHDAQYRQIAKMDLGTVSDSQISASNKLNDKVVFESFVANRVAAENDSAWDLMLKHPDAQSEYFKQKVILAKMSMLELIKDLNINGNQDPNDIRHEAYGKVLANLSRFSSKKFRLIASNPVVYSSVQNIRDKLQIEVNGSRTVYTDFLIPVEQIDNGRMSARALAHYLIVELTMFSPLQAKSWGLENHPAYIPPSSPCDKIESDIWNKRSRPFDAY